VVEVVEYAVRLEYGEVVERSSLHLAERMVAAITSRGGTATLMTRKVVRTDWTEIPEQLAHQTPASACCCGTSPDPGICPIDHDKALPAGGHCACVHLKENADA
jgi:hypothetical protein